MAHPLRWLVPLALSVASCSTFEVQRKQIFLRHVPESDAIDIVLVSEGLQANGDGMAVQQATERVQRMLHGRRDFIVWDLVEMDVDGLVEQQRANPIAADEQDAKAVKAWLDYSDEISAQGALALLDKKHDERLCLLQRVRLAHAAHFLQLIDEFMNDSVPDHEGEDDPNFNALAGQRAKAGGNWAHFEDGSLVVSIPMNEKDAAVTLQKWMKDAASPRRDHSDSQILDSLSAIRITADEMRLTFAPAADGWISFTLTGREKYTADLAQQLGRIEPLTTGELGAELARMKAKP